MSTKAPDLFQRHRLSVQDYHLMGDTGILSPDTKVELINGEIIDMTPIGSRHAGTLNRLIKIITEATGETAILSVQNPIILGDYSEPEPDIALLRPREDFYTAAHPRAEEILLIIEISESSARYDREIKLPIYARHGIPEVWLVDIEHQKILFFGAPREGRYKNISSSKQLNQVSPAELPDVSLDLTVLLDKL